MLEYVVVEVEFGCRSEGLLESIEDFPGNEIIRLDYFRNNPVCCIHVKRGDHHSITSGRDGRDSFLRKVQGRWYAEADHLSLGPDFTEEGISMEAPTALECDPVLIEEEQAGSLEARCRAFFQ